MKYCLQITGLIIATIMVSYDGIAQTSPTHRTQGTNAAEICDNGIDDDKDGAIDCADRNSCAFVPVCQVEDSTRGTTCSDGEDNDEDGLVDCADPDCGCPATETICNDGIDNDGDGLADCDDGDCKDFVSCFEGECNNGVDDDGDGFFDYYDGDCLDDPSNPNDYIITKPDCEARPVGNTFDVNEAWRSKDRTANNRGMPVVADIDNDGTPEVINFSDNTIYVLNGIDGSTEHVYKYPDNKGSDSLEPLAVGDVDNDGYGEIFHLNSNGWIRAMDFDPVNGITTKWTKKTVNQLRWIALADFNQDGKVELYYSNEILDAATGATLVAGSHGKSTYPSGRNNWSTELNGLPVAVDILPSSECTTCNGLELVLGHVIYAVDIAGGKLTEEKLMDDVPNGNKENFTGKYYTKTPGFGTQTTSTTAVVDYNQDGFLDVLMSGAINKYRGPSTIFFWDLKNNSVSAFIVTRPGTTIPATIPRPTGGTANFRTQYRDLNDNNCDASDDCTWIRGVGSLNIANINSDTKLECTFMSGSSLYAIDQDMNLKWANHADFWESTSGITGTAVFDFDGDGASEIIYRDQVDLYVVSGQDGQVLNSQYTSLIKCSSNTAYEYPIVADVDGDGETEIVVSCSTIENEKYESATTNGGSAGHIRVYKASPNQFWVPARSIWNQFTYFNVNVNDNMTIPRYQQPHHLNFSQICNDTGSPNKFSLNKFLNQSPRITFCGDLAFPASKLDFAGDGVTIIPPVCPNDTFEITLSFENNGDYAVNQPIPFSFYSQDPTQAYGNADPTPWLDTLYLSVPGGVQPKQKIDTTITIRGARGQFSLYVSMNDVGPFDKDTKDPIDNASFYPLTKLNGTVRECDGDPTIVAKTVNPIPFELIVSSIDNRRCNDTIGVDNGKIRILDADSKPLTPLSNYQLTLTNLRTNTEVDITKSIADLDSGTFILGLDSGTYAVSAQYRNNAFSCGSAIDTVTINRVEGLPEDDVIRVEKIKDVSSCKPGTADGEARVLINGVLPDTLDYEVRWQNEQDPSEIIFGSTVANLKPVTYDIFVTNLVTGCAVNDSSLTMDLPLPVLDDPAVVHTTSCETPNGSITARMQQGNIIDFDFILIQKSPVQDTTFNDNGVFTGLDEGIYELKAYDPKNDCGLYNEGKIVEIENQAVLPVFTLTQVSPQTACDPALANGHVRATPATPGTYSYEWYLGTVASGSTVSTAADATALGTNGNTSQLYTVVILDGATGCTLSDTVRLDEQLTPPTIDPVDVSLTPRTNCEVPNGTMTVTIGGSTDNYSFRLYKGANTNEFVKERTDGLFDELDAIQYSVVAYDERTGCATLETELYTVTVPDNRQAPVIAVTSQVNQSSCDNTTPNGSISTTADGSTSTTDYTFTWENEDGTGAAYGNTSSITGLKRGNYLITVKNEITKCTETKSIFIDDEIYDGDDIKMTLDVDNVDFCDPYNGRIEVTDVVVDGTSTPVGDYTFTWYEVTRPGRDSTQITGVTGPILDGRQVGQYSIQAFSTVTRCYSTYTTAMIDNDAVQPIIGIDPAESDPLTGCTDPESKFKLKVVLADGSNAIDNYTYEWYLGADVVASNFIQTGQTIENVRATIFTIVATDKVTKCQTEAVVDLSDGTSFLPVIVGQPTATNIEVCNPTSAEKGTTFASVDLFPGKDQNDYLFYWFAGKVAPQLVGGVIGEIDTTQALTSVTDPTKPTARGVSGSGHTLLNLDEGFYTVVVYHPADGCTSVPKTAEVIQAARAPIVQVVNQSDTLCNTLTGRLAVSAQKATNDTTPDTGYSYSWDDDNTVTTAIRSNLAAGEYTVTVTDNTTGCSATETYEIRDERGKPIVVSAVSSDKNDCEDENGTVIVDQISLGSTTITDVTVFESDYNFYLYNNQSDFDPNDPANGARAVQLVGANNYRFIGLEAENYFVAIQKNSSDCVSPFLREVVVGDDTPVMTVSQTGSFKDFVECTDSSEGELTVTMNQNGGVPITPTFTWFEGQSTDPLNELLVRQPSAMISTTGNSSTISGLESGDYTVVVEDLAATGNACPVISYFTIGTRQASPELFVTKLSDQISCDPDGSVEISGIRLNNENENLGDYTYTWYKGSTDIDGANNFKAEAGTTGDNTGTSYDQLSAGTYFVEAANSATGCSTNIIQFTITDESFDLQVIDDFISPPIVACDPSQYAEGEIEIDVLNSPVFFTTWYQGDQEDASKLLPGLTGKETNVRGLVPGTYTVRVTDSLTNCSTVRRYTVQGIEVPLAVFPSSQPQISCTSGDGAVGVTMNGGRGEYVVNWYAGTTTTGTPINANGSFFVENLSSGTYTVAVSDEEDPSCGTETRLITVEDRTGNDLNITVDSDFPMTNCDQSNPNGQLSATIMQEEDLFRYEFFWYQGSTTTGNPIAFGPTATSLDENTYTVVARDRVTGCISDPFTGAVITLLDSGLLPAPTVRMLTPVTHCDNPNGVAKASLDSTLTVDPNIDYEFIWSNAQGQVIFSSDRTNIASQLDTGMYSVIARNTITGCVSAPGEVYVSDSIHIPEFEIVTTPSFCSEPNGTLKIEYYEPIRITNIEWVTPYGFNNGEFLDNQPAGKYTATLTNENGCQFTKEAYVIPGIEVYNAVSPNGDQNNDFFRISCIEDFKDNLVQIYNRSGSLVYEHVGYDNETVFFDGYGNKGVYIGGKELPDGTYFYIVDKRNGDEPESGYLELLR